MRAYKDSRADLLQLPNNSFATEVAISNGADFIGVCPKAAPVRRFDVTAITAAALPGGKLIYNPRVGNFGGNPGPLNDPTALIYVNTSDLDLSGRLKAGVPIEPLVLRATAGDCIRVTLRNRLPLIVPDKDSFNGLPPIVFKFNSNQIRPSEHVGMQPQLLAYDVSRDDGMNVGQNSGDGTVRPGFAITYSWYAGDLRRDPATNKLVATPVEFGTTNLLPADPIEQGGKGLGAVLVVEPTGATWKTDANTRLAATVTSPSATFREFVVVNQNGIQLRDRNDNPICPTDGKADEEGGMATVCLGADDAEETGNAGVNYRSEPMWFRLGFDPGTPITLTRNVDMTNAVSNTQIGGDPSTPVFTAKAGTPVRIRVAEHAGHTRNGVFNLHGHIWQREPYVTGSVPSQTIGNNPLSEYRSMQEGLGTGNHFDIVLQNGAGGAFRIPGDYLLRDQASFMMDAGRWGLVRVQK
jgi:hypothetical protein